MGKIRWVGKHRWNIINLPLTDLLKLYPMYTKDTLKGKKGYWRKKLKEGKIDMPDKHEVAPEMENILREYGIDHENLEDVEVTGFHIGYIKNAEGEIEYTRPLPNIKMRGNSAEFDYQAEPAKITPSRAKPVQRDHKVYFAFGDTQIDYRNIDGELMPIHDERAIDVALQIAKSLRPELIVNLGDNVDLSNLSRFKKDSDHFFRTLAPSFQRAHDIYAQLRSDNPDAKIYEVSSNHEVRLRDAVLQHLPNLYDVRRANEEKEKYPVMSYPYMANLERVGVDWVGGYGAAEHIVNDDLAFRHGTESGNRTQSAASQIMRNHPETNNVHGHAHEMSMASKTRRDGRILASVAVGALCSIDGLVPGYHSAVDDLNQPVHKKQNWQQGVLAIYDYGDGHYQFDNIPINEGRAFYNGREFTTTT